ncbi:non-ribosomal peptide synthetase/MFS transporter [Pseudonocardia sp. TRM90224]|uniref:non-ribosomal peptide synthetase/MFS transporter n=1 Tax=Pseudonocardia sp. TRM90224 TaxID=2812678 RepID=UPI001E56924B|nr:non-ribosomal peptide synthetase [Pseudonocardia sp. TRM90224]
MTGLLRQRLADARLAVRGTTVVPRPDRHAPAPLSSAQARLWFLHRMEPESPAYHVPIVLRLRGDLDVDALSAAVRDLAERHDVLRSIVADAADGPSLVVGPAAAVPVQVRAVRAAELDGEVRAEILRPFALDTQPPMRALVLALDARNHVLVITIHHIATDAESGKLLLADLGAAYGARTGRAPAPPAPPLQHADVTAWAAQDSAGTEADLRWWAEQLAAPAPALDLPADRPVPRRRSAPAAGIVPVPLTADLAARVRAAAADRRGTTPFMVLLAALQALLARVTGSTDISVGVPHTGRHHPGSARVVGCFINTLVVRTDLAGDPSGAELLDRVRDGVLDAFEHAGAPFEKVVERAAPERGTSHNPLFQVLLNMHGPGPAAIDLPGLTAELVEAAPLAAKLDLTVTVVDDGTTMTAELTYARDIFDETTAARFGSWFAAQLDGILADQHRPAGAAPLEPSPTVTGTPASFPAGHGLTALVERWAVTSPDRTAVVGKDGQLTYAELDTRANRLAHRLHSHGVTAQEPVAVACERTTDLVVAMLGALKAGAAYLPLDPTHPAERLAELLRVAGARVLLTQRGGPSAPAHVTVINVDEPAAYAGMPDHRPPVHVPPEQLAYVMFTSGSTGTPKAVAVEHRQIEHYVHAVLDRLAPLEVAGASFALVSTHAADLGLTNVLGALTTGGTLHMIDRGSAVDPEEFAAQLAEHRIDVIKMVPSQLGLLADVDDLATVLPRRLLILAGEPCPADLLGRVRAARPDLAVQIHYGPTETAVSVLGCSVEEAEGGGTIGTAAPLGRPFAGVECHVVDGAGRPVPHGVAGELWIGGPSVARGYLARDDLTAQRFVPDPVDGTTRCYRTGDRVRVRRNGIVEFLGRTDDQIKIRGYRVEPGEVATALRGDPGVAAAVVLPFGDGASRELAAWVVASRGAPQDTAALRARLSVTMPAHMVPTRWRWLAALPLTTNGKIDRAALPAPERPGRRARTTQPTTDTERAVAAAWAEVLSVHEIGPDDNFFALGGHSFSAAKVVHLLRAATGRAVPFRLLFEHPVLRAAAAAVDATPAGTSSTPITRRTDPTAPAPLSAAQRRMWFLAQLDPDGVAYNVPVVLRLCGPLDSAALLAALRDLAERHHVLRSVFPEESGEPVVVPLPPDRVPITLADLPSGAGLSESLAALASRPFGLAAEPPMRATLHRLDADEHVLAMTFHHIATDARSRELLTTDLAQLYAARRGGTAVPQLAEPTLQYADITEWDAAHPDPDAEADLDWWCQELADLEPVLDLPLDRARTPGADRRGDTVPVVLPAGLAAQVRAVAAANACTPFTVVLAAWAAVLARVCRTTDVPIGVPETGRRRPGRDDVVGCFVNTLVMRIDLACDPTARTLLDRARGAATRALAHSETPFERIVGRLRPGRDLTSTPIFQVMLNLAGPPGPPELDGLTVTELALDEAGQGFEVKVDLDLSLNDLAGEDGDLHGHLVHRSALIDRGTAHEICAGFVRQLAAMVTDLDAPVGAGDLSADVPAGPRAAPVPVSGQARGDGSLSSPTERSVAEAWASVLELDDLPGRADDFFGLGGDSFTAVRAVRAIAPKLRVIDLFTHPTVAALAAFLDGTAPATAGRAGLLHRLSGPPAGRTPTATMICLPYGGGSAAVFGPLARAMPDGVAVLGVELPGHDPARPDEAVQAMPEVVARLAREVAESVRGPVLLYGHCVGSAAATALAGQLERDGRTVLGVVLAGSFPSARLPGRLAAWAHRTFGADRWESDSFVRDALRATGGIFDDLDEAATAVALRALRHDATEARSWFTAQLDQPQPARLRAPVLCVVGGSDRATELHQERHTEWLAFAEQVELAVLPKAGHYFLRHQAAELAELITDRLGRWRLPTPPPTPTVPAVATRSLRVFYLVAAGQLLSMTGSALTSFALGIWAYQRSGRIIDLALVVMLAQVPTAVLTPLGGALADRVDRRRIMLTCDVLAGIATAALVVLLATDRLDVWGVCLVVAATSTAAAFHQPAYLAAIAQLVPKPFLPQANALANLGFGIGTVVGPLAGGALMAGAGLTAVVAVDVVTFAVGVVTLLLVRFPDRLFHRQEEPIHKAITGGWRFVARRRPLLLMVGFFAVVNYFTALMWVAVTPLVLGLGTAADLGVVTAAGGVGAAVGALAVAVWGGTRRRATGMIGFVAGSGIGMLVMGLFPVVLLIGIGFFVRLACTSMGNAHWLAIIQVKVGPQLQGRVLSLNIMLATLMQPLGFLTAGPLAEDVFAPLAAGALLGHSSGVALLMATSGLVLLVWGLLGLCWRRLHHLEDDLPDAPTGAEIETDLDLAQTAADHAQRA